MATLNPYRTPSAAVSDHAEEYGEVRVFSSAGRIGRVRYIGYSIGFTLLIGLIGAILGAVLGGAGMAGLAKPFGMLIGFSALAMQMLLTIQRCHDFNANGWVSLVALIPLVNLLFWFVPGTDGPNRYGPPPPPNSAGAVALALILPLIFVVAIMAAISIPAYKSYQDRARAAQQR